MFALMRSPNGSAQITSTNVQAGTLYVVGTPIGNLEDMSVRAVKILQAVDLIAAEDTRHTGKLLHHFQVATPQISYHQHNSQQRIPELVQRLQRGDAIALVSDAGMPGISDPGYELVRDCVAAGILVVPIPGASAAIAALTASGLPTDRFVFEGFLPAKGQDRHQRLQALSSEPRTMILYEAPHRLRPTLADLATMLGGDRQIAIARELTKRYETFWQGSLAAAIAVYETQDPKGEFTLVVAGAKILPVSISESSLRAALQDLLNQGISRSEASRQLATEIGLPRRQIYQLALSMPDLPAGDQ
jgi:16S rRNA (cytidine1402-2'-O)-methyltransferase